MRIQCVRCGCESETRGVGPAAFDLPAGWGGTMPEPVCPWCRVANARPRCASVVDASGVRVDTATVARAAWVGRVVRCAYLDPSVTWVENEAGPTEWRCPQCGGTDFEVVLAYHQPAEALRREQTAPGLADASSAPV